MLIRLTIKNFALLRDTEINFDSGFTAVTGETGTGKSLLVGAISFLAGVKVAPGVVRDDASMAVVEGEFSLDEADDTLIIRRELSANGRSRAFIQDSPVTLKKLSERMLFLVDITAQRAYSHLLEPSKHLDFVDIFARLSEERKRLADFSLRYSNLDKRLERVIAKSREFRERQNLIGFQLDEINKVDPQPGEDDGLKVEIHRLEHFEEFHLNGERFENLLSSNEDAVDPTLAEASQLLENLAGIDETLVELRDEFTSARDALKEISGRVSERCRSLVFDAEQLESLRERQHRLNGIVRKYGGSLTAVLERKRDMERELSAGDANRLEIVDLEKQKEKLAVDWVKLADKVTEARHKAARKLESKVIRVLAELGVRDAMFEVRFISPPLYFSPGFRGGIKGGGVFLEIEGKRWRLTDRGAETAEFFLSTNPGLEPRPLAQVASGGELSRLLLALKEVIPAARNEATVLFDEIDTGVSGRIARLVGKKLKQLAVNRQLVTITHLPQIAGLADHHFRVSKKSEADKMKSEIIELKGEERIQEIALLLSGGTITDAALEQARNLIETGG